MSATQESVADGESMPEWFDPDTPPTEGEPEHRGRLSVLARKFRGPLVLALIALLLGAVGGWLLVQSLQLRDSASATNHAVVDTTTTNQVIGDVSDGLGKIFSYSYDDIAATRQAATQVLTGNASSQYNTLFGQVRQNAATQKLTLTTRVVAAGVTQLDGPHAQLLVFLDQTATRTDTGQTSASAAQLSVSAQLIGGHWLISDIHAR